MPTLAVITTPHWNDLVALGALIVVVALLIKLGCRGIDLAIDAMRRTNRRDFARHAEDARRMAPADRQIAPEDEPSWPGKAPLVVEPVSDQAPQKPTVVMLTTTPAPAQFTLGDSHVVTLHGQLAPTPAETSQPRHARIEPDDTPTGLMAPVGNEAPVVDSEAALEAVAAVVSGQDGAS